MINKKKIKRWNRKYEKHFPDEMPTINAPIDDIKGLREMQKYRRHFPLWGYKWKKAAAEKKKNEKV